MKKTIYPLLTLLLMASSHAIAQDNISQSKEADSLYLDEVVVTGTRIPVSRRDIASPVTLLGRTLLERSENTSVLPALMQNVPGLFITSRGMSGYGTSTGAAGDITIRGMSSSSGRILILIDGHPQYAAIYGHPVADSYMNGAIERVEVIRGPSSVLYGSNAMGGAINLISRGGSGQDGAHLHAGASVGSYGTRRYTLDAGLGGSTRVDFGGSYEKSDGHRPSSSYENLSGHATFSHSISQSWKFSANAMATHAIAHNPGLVTDPMMDGFSNITRLMTGVSLENHHEKSSGAVNLFYNYGWHKVNDGHTASEAPQEYLFHSTDYMGGMNLFQTFNPFKGNKTTAGLDVALFGGNAYRNPETEYYADHIHLHEIGAYALTQQTFGPLSVSAGLRLSHHKKYGMEWIPQAGLILKPYKDTSIRLSVSKGFRSPNLRELYMYVSANEELLPERSWNYDLGYTQSFLEGKILLEADLFLIRGDNLVQVVRTDGRPKNQNIGSFKNKGIELSFAYNILSGLRLNANYAYISMSNPILSTPRHKTYAGITYDKGRWLIGMGYQVVGGLYLQTGDNPIRTGFGLLDAKVDFRLSPHVTLFAKGENLLARRYETVLGFPMPRATVMSGINIRL